MTPEENRTIEAAIARNARLADLCRKANAAVDRLLPPLPRAHGFYEPDGFVRSCQLSVARKYLRRGLIRGLCEKEGLA